MPGEIVQLECPTCSAFHELHLGGNPCPGSGGFWSYEQFVCRACRQIMSLRSGDCSADRVCRGCGGEVAPWLGRIWRERDIVEAPGRLLIAGVCPACDGR